MNEKNASNKLELRLALSRLEFLKLEEKLLLEEKCLSLKELLSFSLDDIAIMIRRPLKTKIWPFINLENLVHRDILLMEKFKIGILHCKDEDYPPLLLQIYDPPYMLFYRGNAEILNTPAVGIVGSRHASVLGQKTTVKFARSLADRNFTIVSGLAYGIDACAHRGALCSSESESGFPQNHRTVAVFACGVDSVYPKANTKLAVGILQNGGCIISEYAPGEAALPYRFLARDRIISALSQAVVVMEAPPKSGSLITADFAIEQNRDLFFHKIALEHDLKLGDDFIKNLDAKTAAKMKEKRVSKYVEDGAYIVESVDEFLKALFNKDNIENI